jgi:thiazole/oxazole-forming peptide maturase SagD family component
MTIRPWWYNRLARPGLKLDTCDDPFVAAVQAEYKRRNRDLWVLDLTTDLGIPTFAAISRRHDFHEEIIQGYGSHFDPQVALTRAITEMNQMLIHLSTGRDVPMRDPDLDYWFSTATVSDEWYLAPDGWRSLNDFPRRDRVDLHADVLECVGVAARAGMDTFVLDQTRLDIGLNVVKVIVPGMRHFWARFADGRLYDVPVAMGWLAQRKSEHELNPLPICS